MYQGDPEFFLRFESSDFGASAWIGAFFFIDGLHLESEK